MKKFIKSSTSDFLYMDTDDACEYLKQQGVRDIYTRSDIEQACASALARSDYETAYIFLQNLRMSAANYYCWPDAHDISTLFPVEDDYNLKQLYDMYLS